MVSFKAQGFDDSENSNFNVEASNKENLHVGSITEEASHGLREDIGSIALRKEQKIKNSNKDTVALASKEKKNLGLNGAYAPWSPTDGRSLVQNIQHALGSDAATISATYWNPLGGKSISTLIKDAGATTVYDPWDPSKGLSLSSEIDIIFGIKSIFCPWMGFLWMIYDVSNQILIDIKNKKIYGYHWYAKSAIIKTFSEFLNYAGPNYKINNCFYFTYVTNDVPKIHYGQYVITGSTSGNFTPHSKYTSLLKLDGIESIFCPFMTELSQYWSLDRQILIDIQNKKIYGYVMDIVSNVRNPIIKTFSEFLNYAGPNYKITNCFYVTFVTNGVPKINYGQYEITNAQSGIFTSHSEYTSLLKLDGIESIFCPFMNELYNYLSLDYQILIDIQNKKIYGYNRINKSTITKTFNEFLAAVGSSVTNYLVTNCFFFKRNSSGELEIVYGKFTITKT